MLIMKKKMNYFLIGLFLSFFPNYCFSQAKSIFVEEGYVSLFNGKNLDGWKMPQGDNGHWSVIEGVIDYDARSEAEGDKNLWTEKDFLDFKLHIEWRFKGYGEHHYPMRIIMPNGEYMRNENNEVIELPGPNSDSGVLLKGVGQSNLWCWSVGSGELWEVRNNKNFSPEIRAAAVPLENADKPVGQWNAFDIIVTGERITVVNNGIVVINNALFPGLNVKGPIGLQHHGGINAKTGKLMGGSSLVQFRNIWIKEL
jgi:hypothetical protein